MENIRKKHDINAFAVRCWPEMFTKFGCASCGPMAMMNEKNISCACEVDVLGSISCNILNQLNGKPSFLIILPITALRARDAGSQKEFDIFSKSKCWFM